MNFMQELALQAIALQHRLQGKLLVWIDLSIGVGCF